MRCLHTEHAKGPASCTDQNGPVKTFCFHFGRVATTRQLIAEIRVSFIEGSAMNRGTMDDKRSGHSCHNLEQLVAQTHHWTTNFLSSETLLKPHSYSCRSLSKGYTHVISQCWEGPLCAGTSPASQSYLFPNFLAGEEATSRPGPHNHECPSQAPILTS